MCIASVLQAFSPGVQQELLCSVQPYIRPREGDRLHSDTNRPDVMCCSSWVFCRQGFCGLHPNAASCLWVGMERITKKHYSCQRQGSMVAL